MARKGKYKIHLEPELYERLEKALYDNHFDLLLEIQRRTKEPGATIEHHKALIDIGFKKKMQTEKKIENAVRMLIFEGKEPTIYQVAKTAGISYNTAKAHKEEIEYYANMLSMN